MSNAGQVYLIPSILHEEGMDAIPSYIVSAVIKCNVFFSENERTARRFLKKLWKAYLPDQNIVIDDYEWYPIHKNEKEMLPVFRKKLMEGKTIGIISEAGCPGIADPGQLLVAAAHEYEASVKPLVGPSSIFMALMASGLNGQQFYFSGYLPIDNNERIKSIRELEDDSLKKKSTQIFIETPYRNNQLLDAVLKTCKPSSRLCIAANLTSQNESVKTKTIGDWSKQKPDLHKQPVIFCLLA